MSEAQSRRKHPATVDDIREMAEVAEERGFDELAEWLADGADRVEEGLKDD